MPLLLLGCQCGSLSQLGGELCLGCVVAVVTVVAPRASNSSGFSLQLRVSLLEGQFFLSVYVSPTISFRFSFCIYPSRHRLPLQSPCWVLANWVVGSRGVLCSLGSTSVLDGPCFPWSGLCVVLSGGSCPAPRGRTSLWVWFRISCPSRRLRGWFYFSFTLLQLPWE